MNDLEVVLKYQASFAFACPFVGSSRPLASDKRLPGSISLQNSTGVELYTMYTMYRDLYGMYT